MPDFNSDHAVWRDGECVRHGADELPFGKRFLGEYLPVTKDEGGGIMASIAAELAF